VVMWCDICSHPGLWHFIWPNVIFPTCRSGIGLYQPSSSAQSHSFRWLKEKAQWRNTWTLTPGPHALWWWATSSCWE
jgi:hypothetical protein